LEEQLVGFDGTLLMVSHDREFLNNVVTSTIAFEPDGPREYIGGYDDWQRQTKAKIQESKPAAKAEVEKPAPAPSSKKKKKLSYNEQRELAGLPEKIEKLEAAIEEQHAAMAVDGYFKQPADVLAENQALLKSRETELAAAYARWEELEGR
jgi:ABC transport system ATP-binding/permease protein